MRPRGSCRTQREVGARSSPEITIDIPDATGFNLSPRATLVLGIVGRVPPGLAIPYPVETQRGEGFNRQGAKTVVSGQIVLG